MPVFILIAFIFISTHFFDCQAQSKNENQVQRIVSPYDQLVINRFDYSTIVNNWGALAYDFQSNNHSFSFKSNSIDFCNGIGFYFLGTRQNQEIFDYSFNFANSTPTIRPGFSQQGLEVIEANSSTFRVYASTDYDSRGVPLFGEQIPYYPLRLYANKLISMNLEEESNNNTYLSTNPVVIPNSHAMALKSNKYKDLNYSMITIHDSNSINLIVKVENLGETVNDATLALAFDLSELSPRDTILNDDHSFLIYPIQFLATNRHFFAKVTGASFYERLDVDGVSLEDKVAFTNVSVLDNFFTFNGMRQILSKQSYNVSLGRKRILHYISLPQLLQNQHLVLSTFYNFDFVKQDIAQSYQLATQKAKKNDSLLLISGIKTLNTISVQKENEFDVELYPNPSNKHFEVNSKEPIESIKVYNNLGKVLLEIKNVNLYKIFVDISYFSSGIYYCIVKTSTKSHTKKIIIN